VSGVTQEIGTATTVRSLRPSTLESLGLGSVHGIFSRGRLPVDAAELVERVFGPATQRGSLVITGASGIVGDDGILYCGTDL